MNGRQILIAWIIGHLVALALAIGAVALAWENKAGWGWFLLVAALTSGTTLKSKIDEKS